MPIVAASRQRNDLIYKSVIFQYEHSGALLAAEYSNLLVIDSVVSKDIHSRSSRTVANSRIP